MEKRKVIPVELRAEGKLCGNKCGTCRFIQYSRDNGKGEYYCPHMAEGSFWSYVDPDESACRYYEPR